MRNDSYDVIIIGGGVSASVAAYNLSLSNIKVACFEQGDFEKNSFNYKKKNLDFLNYKKLNINPNIRKSQFDYPIDDSLSDVSIANFNGVGGSSVLYSAHLPRFLPQDFTDKVSYSYNKKWPINYDSLKKYYDLNEKILGVAGLKGDKSYPDEINNLLPPVKFGSAVIKIIKSFQKLGWHWWPSYSGVITKKIDNRKKNSFSEPNNSYWPKAINNNVTLFTKSKVLKIICDNNKANKIIFLDEKKKIREKKAKIFILAASGLGTPRILLNSQNKFYPNGLGNFSGMVGKNLMLHPLGWVEGKFPNFIKSYDGPQGCSIYSTEFCRNKKFKKGYAIQILREPHPVEHFVMRKKLNQLNFGSRFLNDVFKYYGKTISAAIICEDLPEEKNQLILDKKNCDIDGMPGVKIIYKMSKNTKNLMSAGISNCKKILQEAGANNIISFGPVRHAGWHIMGTARMGFSRYDSVVNKNGKCHDIKNLYITDSSIFCSSSSLNPVSTICALTFKITEHIKKIIK